MEYLEKTYMKISKTKCHALNNQKKSSEIHPETKSIFMNSIIESNVANKTPEQNFSLLYIKYTFSFYKYCQNTEHSFLLCAQDWSKYTLQSKKAINI